MAYSGMMFPINQHPAGAGGGVRPNEQMQGYHGSAQHGYEGERDYVPYALNGAMWSYPQAPRLSAAAVRASSMAVMYPYQSNYPQYPQFYPPTSTPWGNTMLDSYGRQHQDHQQLEHQLMLHHQLSKLQGPQHVGSYGERNGDHAYRQSGSQGELDGAYRSGIRHDSIDRQYARPPSRYGAQSAHLGQQNQNDAYTNRSVPYQHQDSHMRSSYASQQHPHRQTQPHAVPSHSLPPQALHYAIPTDPRLSTQRGSDGTWDAYNSGRRSQEEASISAQSQAHAQAQAQAQVQAQMHAQAQAEAHAQAQAHIQAQAQAHAQAQAMHGKYWEAQRRASQWGSTVAIADPHAGTAPAAEVEAPPAALNDGPAPPSPDTLDRSAVPISSFGAELIWAVAAAMLEPSLLPTNGARGRLSSSGSALSTSSSPLLSTPASSPWASATLPKGEWSAPPVTSPSSLTSPQTRVNVFDVPTRATASHRFAVQAPNKQQNSQPRQRTSDTVDSVGASPTSSVSSSEPGTPPSMRSSAIMEDAQQSSGNLAIATRGLGLAHVAHAPDNDLAMSDGNISPLSKGSQVSSARLRSESRSRSITSMQKLQSAVTSVMDLISPDWNWSVNDDKLPSLRCDDVLNSSPQSVRSGRSGSLSGVKTLSRRTSGTGLGALDGDAPAFSHSSGDASPAFRRFVHQVLAQTLMSPTAFLLALMYTIRMPYLFVNDDGVTDQEALQIFAQPPSAAPFKLLTLGLMISNKHLDDNTFLNKTWNEVTGIALVELNTMERYFLKRSSFEISAPDELWSNFVLRVRQREEAKLVAHRQARLPNTSSHSRGPNKQPQSIGRSPHDNRDSQVSNEDCSRRVIMSIDDMLAQLGQIPPLTLSESAMTSVAIPSSPIEQMAPVASEPLPHREIAGHSDPITVSTISYDDASNQSLTRSHCDYVDRYLGKPRTRHSIVLPRMQSSPTTRAARRASEYGPPTMRFGALSRRPSGAHEQY